jgi:hypothetical protein
MSAALRPSAGDMLRRGTVIPAHPLALDAGRCLDDRRMRALTRYYLAAGAGGLAAAVHTTQFEIRDPKHALLKPVLTLVVEEMAARRPDAVRIAGICGRTSQAVAEASLARDLGYDIGLVSLAAFARDNNESMIEHCRAVAEILPIMGFYLQPAVGGRSLDTAFWRSFSLIEGVVAIKVAPFNRYATRDVLRGVAESGRASEIALYTGNDDHILLDLLVPHEIEAQSGTVRLRFVGGLLGQWAVWTRAAVRHLEQAQDADAQAGLPAVELLAIADQMTEANQAIFDVPNGFQGCIPGIHEVLYRAGLLPGTWCLDPDLGLSPGQAQAIDRIVRAYPHLTDDEFVKEHLDEWLSG